jgi:diketogulonate reductase-like aldo/keto reductase
VAGTADTVDRDRSRSTREDGVALDALVADGRARVLADGHPMPLLGLGVWQVPDGPECVRAVREALDAGYQHLDTAQLYGNEASVGRGLRESGVPRDDVFITTKFYPSRRDPAAEAEQSLRRLGVDRVDLYLVHWPQRRATGPWPGMEAALARGSTTSIGVSNYGAAELDEVLALGGAPPVVNQVQFSPFEYRRGLLEHCEARGVVLESYSTLGTGHHLRDRAITDLAARVGHSPAQVLLRWCVQRGIPVIPKSTHRVRIEENARIFDFTLSAQDMAELDALDTTGDTSEARGA